MTVRSWITLTTLALMPVGCCLPPGPVCCPPPMYCPAPGYSAGPPISPFGLFPGPMVATGSPGFLHGKHHGFHKAAKGAHHARTEVAVPGKHPWPITGHYGAHHTRKTGHKYGKAKHACQCDKCRQRAASAMHISGCGHCQSCCETCETGSCASVMHCDTCTNCQTCTDCESDNLTTLAQPDCDCESHGHEVNPAGMSAQPPAGDNSQPLPPIIDANDSDDRAEPIPVPPPAPPSPPDRESGPGSPGGTVEPISLRIIHEDSSPADYAEQIHERTTIPATIVVRKRIQ